MQWAFHEHGVHAAFVGSYRLTGILPETVTNNATAALAFPLAWSTAQAFGTDPMPFIMAAAFGASACFLAPYGYQTHLVVYTPGRYRMNDYVNAAVPITLIYSVLMTTLTPLALPF